ncbi:MAG: phosphatase PAP2 family protein, partial [Bacteroidota bacterium]
ALFLLLNGWHHAVVDPVMAVITYKFTGVPLYLLALYYITRKHGINALWVMVPGMILLVTLTDQVHVHFFKEYFMRYRPCKNLLLMDQVHLVVGCGGKYGFVSGHATTNFGIAFLLSAWLRNRAWTLGLFGWAALVAYSRIYVGVHYPGDIAGGVLLGFALSGLVLLATRWGWQRWLQPSAHHPSPNKPNE